MKNLTFCYLNFRRIQLCVSRELRLIDEYIYENLHLNINQEYKTFKCTLSEILYSTPLIYCTIHRRARGGARTSPTIL